MERTRTKAGYQSVIIIYGIFITAWFFWAVFGAQISRAVFEFLESTQKEELGIATSTDFRFPEKFQGTLEQYPQFGEMYQSQVSTAIPGLNATKMGDFISGEMVPQGLCVAGDYMLITAYDGKKAANSVIYVLSNGAESREYLTTIVLPDQNHVGGITFDGQRIWIAKSTSGYCSTISYEQLREAAELGADSYQLSDYEDEVYCGVTASFVTYDQGRLWVGTYRSKISGKGRLYSYQINETQEGIVLELLGSSRIPAYAQGISFLSEGEENYMLLTTSCGRYNDSQVYLYQLGDRTDDLKLELKDSYVFPPMVEEVATDGEYTYFLFESAASCYSTVNYRKCPYPVDRVCGISTSEFLAGN